MDLVVAAFLGFVQGITEFLPVSSSAHLILVPWIFGWEPNGLVFDVALHVGTALAVLGYFWRDWLLLAREALTGIFERKPFANSERRLAWFLVIGTIPAVVVGLAFEKSVEETLRSPLVTVVTLVVFGVFLYYADHTHRHERGLAHIGLSDAILIGAGQAAALIPGVSRSGITISLGLLRNLDRTSSARFSFLLATPVIVGAGLLEGIHLIKALREPTPSATLPAISLVVLAVGTVTSAVTGFLCIRYFLRYIQTHSFTPFVVYRFVLAAVVLAMYLT